MKKIYKFFLILIILIPLNIFALENNYTDVISKVTGAKIKDDTINIYLFRIDGCPHCANEEKWLEEIKEKYANSVNIYDYEIKNNKQNKEYYLKAKEVLKDDISKSVPYTVIGEKYYVGFSDTIKEKMETEIDNLINNISEDKDSVKIPLLGKVNMKSVSIPIVAIILGTVDGFNPCAMWILLLLINMCITIKDKKKMKIVGFTFIFTSALVYFLSMLGIGIILDLSAVLYIRNIIAVFAIILGIYNLYVYIKTRKITGCHVVKKEKRQNIISKINNILCKKSTILMLIATIFFAISVNLIELACSLGFPAIFLEMLSLNKIYGLKKIIYLLIYIFFYIIDDTIILILSIKAFEAKGISTKYNKYVNLIGGILLLVMGILLILKPEWIMFNF